MVACSVGTAPQEIASRLAFDRPPVLVYQPVVKGADQRKVVEISSATVAPPDEVVRLGEPSRAASRESALAVAMPHLSNQPRGRLTTEATDAQDVPVRVLHDGLTRALQRKRRTVCG